MKKRMVSLLLALAMVMGLSATAFASEINTTEKAQWLIKYDEGKTFIWKIPSQVKKLFVLYDSTNKGIHMMLT